MITDAAPRRGERVRRRAPGPAQDPDYRDMPFYWFLRWDQATNRGDQQAADHAQRELKRLGYTVGRCRRERRRRCPA